MKARPRVRKEPRGPFARAFRAARAARGMTQAQAAEDLGVGRVTVARWETGSHRPEGLARRFVVAWIKKTRKRGADA